MLENKSVKREYELDALRGIAATLVVFFHYRGLTDFDLSFLRFGVTGVDLFFLISGYVIFMTLEKARTVKDFVISRLSRIYPSYLSILFLTVVIIFCLNRAEMPSLRTIIGNLSMMQPLALVPNIDDVYWTLTVEIQFYILMLFVFWTGNLGHIERIGILLVLAIQVFYLSAGQLAAETKLFIWPRAFLPLINHFHLFFAGIVFYKLRKEGRAWYRHLIVAGCFLSSFLLFPGSGKSHYFMNIYEYAAVLFIYFGVFYLFVFDKLRFISLRPLIFLGSISYALYLVHLKSGHTIYFYVLNNYAINRTLLAVSVLILMVLISSFVTFRIEQPVISLIRKKFIRKPSPASRLANA